MKIYIYPYDNSNPQNCYDITPYIQNVDAQKRSDDAFAITTFKAVMPNDLFNLVKYNIQPFTIFEIAPNNEAHGNSNNTRYFGYSKCNKYLRTQNNNKTYYVHDITLVEPLAILEAIQIGTKTFSYHKDTYYLNIIKELIRVQYGINIYWVLNNWENTEMHNFSFDKGSTAFSICNEILRVNNLKMVAKFETPYGSDPYDIRIVITPFDVSNIQTVSINESKLTLVEYNQDFNNYCYNLESQVDNVVDRNSTTLWHNLTPRSDEPTATADNCFIELPEVVESIEELKVKIHFEEEVYFRISDDELAALRELGTYQWSWDDLVSVASWLSDFADELTMLYPYFNPSVYTYEESAGMSGYNIVSSVPNAFKWLDISPICVEQSIYQSISANNQPNYCFYRSGSNRIEGIYKFYKDDWVHQLIGETNTPMLQNLDKLFNFQAESSYLVSSTEHGAVKYEIAVSSSDANPLEALFSVRAHAISSQYVKDVKVGTPMNASSYFNVSRSYGDSANYVDYDIMRKNIKIANKSLGTPELTLQFLNECNLTANSSFVYDSQTWYVMSIVMQIFRNRITYTVNASTDYNKQASCIGVRTQFETTKIALNNIKQRHLYYRLDDSISFNKDTMYYLDIEFTFESDSEASREYILPLTIYESEDGLTLVHNFVDNYSCGTYLTNDSGGRFVQKDASYVDDNGETESFTKFKIITYTGNDLNDELSRKLPLKPNNPLYIQQVIKDIGRKIIYKDNHEALAITIYMPNAHLIESN